METTVELQLSGTSIIQIQLTRGHSLVPPTISESICIMSAHVPNAFLPHSNVSDSVIVFENVKMASSSGTSSEPETKLGVSLLNTDQ